MKIEKLTENKIKITLNIEELSAKNIDFHSFMSNSLETQDLFLDLLDEAEEKVGFITKDYKLRIEALALSDGIFVVTVTRSLPPKDLENLIPKTRKLTPKRKQTNFNSKQLVYCFNNFEDFCEFSNLIGSIDINTNFSKSTSLYYFKEKYYLIFNNIDTNSENIHKIYSLITEFASFVHDAELFATKLSEYGNAIIKNNAIKTCLKFF